MLLSHKGIQPNYPNGTKCLRRRSAQKQAPSPAMVEPPVDDIYLCDNCDAEFAGLGKMKVYIIHKLNTLHLHIAREMWKSVKIS